MTIQQALEERSGSLCELCGAASLLEIFAVEPSDGREDQSVIVCHTCLGQLDSTDGDYWRCLKDTMWSTVPAVQVMVCRLLKKHSSEAFAQSLLDMLYLEPEVQTWADASEVSQEGNVVSAKDSNGTQLCAGDSVTVIKDLDVKGAGFTAKRGTTVKNISLTQDPDLIEGRVNGIRIVLKTCFLKKL